jgi:DUF1365 family protein
MTHKVTATIHWEAVRLWLKGLKLRARPLPPEQPATVVRFETHQLRKEKHV